MSESKDWLSRGHEELYDQARQTKVYFANEENRIRMGFAADTPQGQWLDNVFGTSFTAFGTAFEAWRNPATRTPVVTARLVEKQTIFVKDYRLLYSGFIKNNPFITDIDLTAMGMPTHSTGSHTPIPAPTTVPEFSVDTSVIRCLKIHFHDAGSSTKAKPHGVHGAEIRWAIRETDPQSINELFNSSFDTHTPFTLSFDQNERGKLVYICLRWENSKGDKGPWSEIVKAIIP